MLITISLLHLSPPARAQDVCVELIKGSVAIDVTACAPFTPDVFNGNKHEFQFIKDLDPAQRNDLFQSYSGLIIRGTVVLSNAVRTGISTSKGVLHGQKEPFFIRSGQTTCEAIKSKRISAMLNEQCCNGSAAVPCLLENGYLLTDVKVMGGAVIGSPAEVRPARKPHTKAYIDADKKYAARKYQEAIDLYLAAERENDMDVPGLFHMGFAYRAIEKCDKAIVPLTKIMTLKKSNKVWAEDELSVRRGQFLLARCHAKSGSASDAIFYLEAFLLDPKKYKTELQLSLTQKDFGWIHSSKEYIEYKAKAERKLK